MARRSPLNKRYQKDAKIGSTRKSAAAARPKRSSGTGTSGSSAKKSSGASKSSRGGRSQRPETPEDIKRLQKISFALLGVAVALSVLYLWRGKAWGTGGALMLGAAYACMFTALYLDFAKVRPVLKAIRAGQAPPTSATRNVQKRPEQGSKPSLLSRFGWKTNEKLGAEAEDERGPDDDPVSGQSEDGRNLRWRATKST